MLAALFSATALQAQDVRFLPEDVTLYNKVMPLLVAERTAHPEAGMPALILTAAQAMLGTPYVANTLEKEPETLTVSLSQTDCILFVEACACLAYTSYQNDTSFEAYCDHLRTFRYRNGITDGYGSRVHYTSEWILQGASRPGPAGKGQLLREVSQDIAHTSLAQTFSFMSKHPDKYPALAAHPEYIPLIAQTEATLNAQTYYFIPKEKLADCLDLIQDGDMICFVTNTEGVDISHVAYAYIYHYCTHDCCEDGTGCSNGQRKVGFLHASSVAKEVVKDSQTLLEYVLSRKSCTGIRVVRF